MIWHRAVRDLLRHRSRTLLTLLGVAIATALLLDMVLLSGGIERSFGRLLASSGYQLRITPRGTLPFDTDATIDRAGELAASLRSERGVAEVGAVLGTSALARRPGAMIPLVVYGVTPGAQAIYRIIRGADLGPADTGGILLGAPSSQRLGAGVGDTVRLVGRLDPRVATAAVERTVVVRGVARYVYDASDQASVAVVLPLAQHLAGPAATDRVSMLLVRTTSDTGAATVAASLRARYPGVGVNSVADMVAQFRKRLSYFRQLSIILGSIALVVTILLVSTLLAISVNERIGDIATLRAIGIARLTILRQILLEGTLLTIAGGLLGVGIGLGTARWLDGILKAFPGLPAAISFFAADARPLATAAVTFVLTGVVAGLIPAWRATTTPIAATLRSDAP